MCKEKKNQLTRWDDGYRFFSFFRGNFHPTKLVTLFSVFGKMLTAHPTLPSEAQNHETSLVVTFGTCDPLVVGG